MDFSGKLNFTDYYKSYSESQGELRRRICDRLEISFKTFYNKMNGNSWTTIELEAIEKIVNDLNTELSNAF